jgi:CheY-like chemotaxis protein
MTAEPTWAAPPLPAGPRRALVIGIAGYADEALRRLRSPALDAAALRAVLADPESGGFAVTALADGTAADVRGAVVDFTAACERDDLALVYLSCHGLLDARRRLWFAAADTVKTRMAATGVEATWLMDRMADCRARQQVVILDCCFSGAFAEGAKGDADALATQLRARGTVVLTASRASEYSFEGDPIEPSPSIFTAALVEGLRTGAADTDNDGLISVDDAYAYAYQKVAPTQTPQRWSYGAEGRIILARSPAGVRVTPAELPADLRALLEHPRPGIRAAALDTVAEWLTGPPAQVLAARAELRRVAAEDLPRVGDRARALLGDQAVPVAVPQAHRDLAGLRLLWLDDNPENNEFMIEHLVTRGAVVYAATTGEHALQLLARVRLNVLVTDINRYGSNVGFADLRALRDAGFAGPALFFTSRLTEENRTRAKDAGAEGIVSSTDEIRDWLVRVRRTLRDDEPPYASRMRDALSGR